MRQQLELEKAKNGLPSPSSCVTPSPKRPSELTEGNNTSEPKRIKAAPAHAPAGAKCPSVENPPMEPKESPEVLCMQSKSKAHNIT